MQNINRIDFINFKLIQIALIAFQNDDQNEIFAYYSSKNKRILLSLKKTSYQINKELQTIRTISDEIEDSMKIRKRALKNTLFR